jgi:outer membrane protein
MKKILLTAAVMLMIAVPAFAAGGKMAYVDTQAVFDKTKLGKKYQGTIRDYYESRKKIVDMDKEEIQKMQEDYAKQRQAKLLNEKAQKEKEETIGRKMNELERKMSEFNGEIGKKREDLFGDFNQRMMVIIKDIAKKEKASMVFSKGFSMQTVETPIVLFADEDMDLTEKVIAEMDKREDVK